MSRLISEDAKKYRFAALGQNLIPNPAKRRFIAPSLISRDIYVMVFAFSKGIAKIQSIP